MLWVSVFFYPDNFKISTSSKKYQSEIKVIDVYLQAKFFDCEQ